MTHWRNFKPGKWENEIDVRDFIVNNYTEYTGDSAFLAGPTEDTLSLWENLGGLMEKEREKGCFADTKTVEIGRAHV